MDQNNTHSKTTRTLLQRWTAKLQKRWGVTGYRLLLILLVFACAGTTVVLLKKPLVNYFSGNSEPSIIFSVLYYILILPIYNAILLIYGFIFGQFKFFWAFEKKMIHRILGRSQSKK